MYSASKRLVTVRNQLKRMQEQYTNGTEIDKDDELRKSAPTDMEQDLELYNGALTQSHSNKGPLNIPDNFTMSVTPLKDNSLPDDDTLKPLVDNSYLDDGTLHVMEDTNSDDLVSFSEELRSALSTLEEIDCTSEVTDISENFLHLTPAWSQYNEPLSIIAEDEKQINLDRQKKDNHNIVERRRRYNINDRIKELASLLPETDKISRPMNKGSILKAVVNYVNELKKSQERLMILERSYSDMKSKHQKLLIRTLQLELKLSWNKLSSDGMHFTKKKRKRRKCVERIDKMLDMLLTSKISDDSDGSESRSSKLQGKRVPTASNSKRHVSQILSSRNEIMSSKQYTLTTNQQNNFLGELPLTVDTSSSNCDIEFLKFSKNDVPCNSKTYFSGLCHISKSTAIKDAAHVQENASAGDVTLSPPQDGATPCATQSNILESLLRRPKLQTKQNSEDTSL